MKTYLVTSAITITVHTKVEASSKKEAKMIALERGVMGLCYQCGGSNRINESWVTSGELDGSPEKILEIEEEK